MFISYDIADGVSTSFTIWNNEGCEAASTKIKHFLHHLAWLSLCLKGED